MRSGSAVSVSPRGHSMPIAAGCRPATRSSSSRTSSGVGRTGSSPDSMRATVSRSSASRMSRSVSSAAEPSAARSSASLRPGRRASSSSLLSADSGVRSSWPASATKARSRWNDRSRRASRALSVWARRRSSSSAAGSGTRRPRSSASICCARTRMRSIGESPRPATTIPGGSRDQQGDRQAQEEQVVQFRRAPRCGPPARRRPPPRALPAGAASKVAGSSSSPTRRTATRTGRRCRRAGLGWREEGGGLKPGGAADDLVRRRIDDLRQVVSRLDQPTGAQRAAGPLPRHRHEIGSTLFEAVPQAGVEFGAQSFVQEEAQDAEHDRGGDRERAGQPPAQWNPAHPARPPSGRRR